MGTLQIEQIPVLNDNYVYALFDPATQVCAVVDPAESAPVKRRLDELGWRLTHIFNTHHHHDHTGGNLALKKAYECEIIGAGIDAARIPGIDREVFEQDRIVFGSTLVEVMEVPGHTSGHIAYYIESDHALFCGDTLFALGCGRLFEGSAAQMWSALARFRELPGATRVYCAHEYTQSNAAFALSVDPENAALRARNDEIDSLRAAGKPTVPSRIAQERATNPFMRADDPVLQAQLGMAGADSIEVFAEIRRRKDNF